MIEGEIGESIKLSPDQLRDILSSKKNKQLNIAMVVLAIPNGEAIGKVFMDLGVKQIFVFRNIFPGVKHYDD